MQHESLFVLDTVGVEIGARALLADVALRLEPGKIYGLVGANGSGKSTLVKLLARQSRPTSGAIWFEGAEIDALPPRAFARAVAYMPQFTPPAEGMTVRELVALGRFPWHGAFGRFGIEDGAKVAAALADTGLEPLADRLVDTLSGGERQRAWLAMMLAQDARCLLLDEPTSALDIAHQVEVLQLVKSLNRARGLGAVVVLHDVNMAARLCDEIVALKGGRLIAQGAPAALMTPVRLAEIYDLPMGIFPHPESGEPIGYVRDF
jgi:ferric hydroxamate transport system ATP-binding protein